MNLLCNHYFLSIYKNSVLLTSKDKKTIFLSISRDSSILTEDLLIFLKNLDHYQEIHNIPKETFKITEGFLKNQQIQLRFLEEIRNFKKNKIFNTYTLCLVADKNRILLGKKKKGLGKGYYNGFGGKLEPGERVIDAAIRELYEEAGIIAKKLTKAGKLFFNFSNSKNSIEGHVFFVKDYEGIPKETQEMLPQWFSIPEEINFDTVSTLNQNLPFNEMWEDDLFWFPFFLRKQYFLGFFELNEKNQMLSLKLLCKTKNK